MSNTKSKAPASRGTQTHGAERTRELLLEAGKKVFARQGYDGATVKDIADAAGVNISLVSYHFQGKEGLFRACLEQFGQSRLSVAQRLLQKPESKEEVRVRIQMFIGEVLGCFKDEPDLTQMINREFELGTPVARDIFENTFLKVHHTLRDFLESALEKGFLRAGVDPKIAASFLFGSINYIARMDPANRMFFKTSISDPKYRELLVMQFVQLFLDGTLANKTPDDSTSTRS